jgi:hypothetical protein
MCDPVSLSLVGIAAAGAVGSVALQDQQRRTGNKLKDQAAALEARRFGNQQASVSQGLTADQIGASETKQALRISGLQARATSQVGASASGVEGLSVDAVLDDFDRQVGTATSQTDLSLDINKSATNLGLEGARIGSEGALFNLRPEKFNPAAAALQIGEAAFSGAVAGGFGKAKVKQAPSGRQGPTRPGRTLN